MVTRFEPKKINLNRINGGIAYQDGDTPQPNLFNDVAQNAAYCAEQIEGILHPPEVVETDPNLPPSVEWVQTFVNGRAYQKLRFSNLKGAPVFIGEGVCVTIATYNPATEELTVRGLLINNTETEN